MDIGLFLASYISYVVERVVQKGQPMYKRYRLMETTIAMFEEDGCHVAHHVPAGSTIMIDGALDGDQLMNVLWADKKVFMFTQDLRTRAEQEPESST